jgi:hypothetical protein
MNELILELAKQAGLKFSSETAMSPVELKFAELIVRECASRCLLTPLDHILGGEAFSTRIKQHFGVEE